MTHLAIDVGSVAAVGELHALLARVLRFPGYYGHNWDAFWDCVTDPGQSDMPSRLEIVGVKALRLRFPRDAELLEQIVADLRGERPELSVELRP